MKNIYSYIITLAFVFGLASCEHYDLDLYSGKDDVYFHFGTQTQRTYIVDSTKINFGYDEVTKSDSIIAIKMKLFGYTRNIDRPINYIVTVAPSSGARPGVDFEPLYDQSFIPANSDIGYIRLKLYNTERIKEETLKLTINTAPNEYFSAEYDQLGNEDIYKEGIYKSNIYKVYFDSKEDMPNMWADYPNNFVFFFGAYSNVKFTFMCETLNMTREYFTYDPNTEVVSDVFRVRFPTSLCMAWKQILKQTLADLDEPLIDEDGKPVVFP